MIEELPQNEVAEEPKRSFREHYARLEEFVDACNRRLRERGFRVCEATATANWMGQAILSRMQVTAAVAPNGLPLVVGGGFELPLPTQEHDVEDILNRALKASEDVIGRQCAAMRVLRISFDEYARRVSCVIAAPTPANGRSVIVRP